MRHTLIIAFLLLGVINGKANALPDTLLVSHPLKALEFSKEELQRTSLTKKERLEVTTYALEATLKLAEYDEAIALIKASDELIKHVKDSNLIAKNQRIIARLDAISYRHMQALERFTTVAGYYYKNHDFENFCLTKVNLAEFYRISDNFLLAERHLHEVLSYASKISDTVLCNAYHRLAAVAAEKNWDTAKIILYSKQAIELAERIHLPEYKATSLVELGTVYCSMGKKQALPFFIEAYEIFKKNGSHHSEANALFHISHYHFKMGNMHLAQKYGIQCTVLCDAYGLRSVKIRQLGLSARIYASMQDYREAYKARSDEADLMREWQKWSARERIDDVVQKYEAELALMQLKASEKDRTQALAIADREKDVRKRLVLTLILLAVLLLSIALSFLSLKRSNIAIKEQQLVIEDQNKSLSKSIDEKEMLLHEVHHRVKNNFQFILAMLEMQLKSGSEQNPVQVIEEIISRLTAMALVHEQLYSQKEPGKVFIDEYIQQLVHKIELGLPEKLKHLEFKLDLVHIELGFSRSIALGMILSEIITNAIKYAFEGIQDPKLELQLSSHNNEVELVIFDNGFGIEGEQKEGFGSKMIKLFLRQLQAKSKVITNRGFYYQIVFKV